MPDTGKELAAKRGIEYNPADEEQNALLASDYANQLYGKYGSETLAGAAYNWGMGNVDKLIAKAGDPRKGEISEADFVRQLPAETRGWLARYRKIKPVSIRCRSTKSITSPSLKSVSNVRPCASKLIPF